MAYQFLHVNVYSRKAGKGKAGGRTVQDIIDEVTREPSASKHVEDPQPPIVVYGCNPADIPAMCDEYAASMVTTHERKNRKTGETEKVTRKMRDDGLVMLAGVFSAPVEMPAGDWPEYRARMVEKLREEYGDRLKSVGEHFDEAYRHCHFYIIPRPGERLDDIHPGRAAARASKERDEPKGKQNTAYIAAMRKWQDSYWQGVSADFGLARLGPKKQRLNRPEYVAQQAELARLAQLKRDAEARQQQLAQEGEKVKQYTERAQVARERALAAKQEAEQVLGQAATWGGRIGAFLGGLTGAFVTAATAATDYLRERGWWPGIGRVKELEQEAQQHSRQALEKRREAAHDRELARLEKQRAAGEVGVLHGKLVNLEGQVRSMQAANEVLAKHNNELSAELKDLGRGRGNEIEL